MDQGVHLKIFVTEHERHNGELLFEFGLPRGKG
jgi:hypothetical protein